jgi:hypothetical protein
MIAAVGDAGGYFTRVDPINGMWDSHVTVPTTVSNHGDFSQVRSPVMDFAQGCRPFPNNTVPDSRLDGGTFYWAEYDLPGAKIVFPEYAAGTAELHGAYPPAASGLGISGGFADYFRLPCGFQKTRTATFTIHVNGRAVTSRNVTYPIAGR